MALRAHELANSFGTAPTEYDRLRSGPPKAAVDWMLGDGISSAVEIGAGTGHLSRILASRITELFPVEPDPRMREVFANSCPGLAALAGTAEKIPVADHSVDAVFAADSWHWFDPETTSREIARVLRPGGLLAVSWNRKDDTVGWMDELFGVTDNGQHPVRQPGTFELPANSGFRTPERRVFGWTRSMTPQDLVALLGTYSVVLTMSESDRGRLFDASFEYIDKHPELTGRELIDVPFRTECWRTRLEPVD